MVTKFVSNMLSWYFKKQSLPSWCILLLDTIITVFSFLFFYAVVAHNDFVGIEYVKVLTSVAIFMVFFLLGFRLFHTYNGVIRYSSFVDLSKIVKANLFGGAFSLLISVLTSAYIMPFPIMAIILATMFATAIMWLVRVFAKLVYEQTVIIKTPRTKVFIYGVRAGGIAISKSIRSDENSPYSVAGFISDRRKMAGLMLDGKPIYFNDSSIPERMKSAGASILLVSPFKNELLRNNHELVDALIANDIKIHMTSPNVEWDGKSEMGY